jgi:hypothetical protein
VADGEGPERAGPREANRSDHDGVRQREGGQRGDGQVGAAAVNIEVTLLDANDNNPTFIPNNLYNYIVNGDVKVGDVVGQIHAIDPDLGRNGMVHYHIQKAPNNSIPFKVDGKTRQDQCEPTAPAPRKHLLFVEASDQPLNPSERRSSLAVVSIEVQGQPGKGQFQ